MRQNYASNEIAVHLVHDASDPWFQPGFEELNTYFGDRGEMETLDVIRSRLKWNPATLINGFSLFYELVVLTDAENAVVGAGDFTVILSHSEIKKGQAAVVHLSHIWADPTKPSTGIVSRQMNEVTINATRVALQKAALPIDTPITFAAEMEPLEAGNEERRRRFKRFLHAGLCIVDPDTIHYFQPDFNSAEDIDKAGKVQPLLLTLMLRRIEREAEDETNGAEILHIVSCLYHMYGQTMRVKDMAVVYETLKAYPAAEAPVRLLKRI